MYKIKLISILFLLILLNISCKSTSYLSSEEEGYQNNEDIYYVYGLGTDPNSNSPDPNTICQYICNFTDRYRFFHL